MIRDPFKESWAPSSLAQRVPMRGWNLENLKDKVFVNKGETVQFLMNHKAISSEMKCPDSQCGLQMTLQPYAG